MTILPLAQRTSWLAIGCNCLQLVEICYRDKIFRNSLHKLIASPELPRRSIVMDKEADLQKRLRISTHIEINCKIRELYWPGIDVNRGIRILAHQSFIGKVQTVPSDEHTNSTNSTMNVYVFVFTAPLRDIVYSICTNTRYMGPTAYRVSSDVHIHNKVSWSALLSKIQRLGLETATSDTRTDAIPINDTVTHIMVDDCKCIELSYILFQSCGACHQYG